MANILLLEDSEPLSRLLAHALNEEGHTVTPSPDGVISYDVEALAKTDVMITDLVMPRVNGIEAILTAKKFKPDLKIIAMSGGGVVLNDDCLPVCKEIGAAATLRKPFEPAEMIEMLKEVLAA